MESDRVDTDENFNIPEHLEVSENPLTPSSAQMISSNKENFLDGEHPSEIMRLLSDLYSFNIAWKNDFEQVRV